MDEGSLLPVFADARTHAPTVKFRPSGAQHVVNGGESGAVLKPAICLENTRQPSTSNS